MLNINDKHKLVDSCNVEYWRAWAECIRLDMANLFHEVKDYPLEIWVRDWHIVVENERDVVDLYKKILLEVSEYD